MINEFKMKDILKNSLQKAIDYTTYKTLVNDLLLEGKSTGPNQSEALTNYSTLNAKRIKRLDKTVKIDANFLEFFKSDITPQTWLVITEGWCGDAAQNIPVINKIAELNYNISLQFVLRDEHEALMEHFLTNGNKAIPKLVALNEDLDVLFTWGPRPTTATKLVADYKEAHGKLTPEFKQDLQVWYNKNKGLNLQEDFVELLKQNSIPTV